MGSPRSSSGRSPLVPRASLISRLRSGAIRSTRPIPKRRTAEAVRPGTRVNPRQAVGREGNRQGVERAPTLIAVEQLASPRSSPRRAPSTSTWASAATSRKPRLSPWPAIGWMACAASPTQSEPVAGDLRRMVEAERVRGARGQHARSCRGNRPSPLGPPRRNPRRSSDSQPAASPSGTDQTIAERCPPASSVIGSKANGPVGIENLIGDMVVRHARGEAPRRSPDGHISTARCGFQRLRAARELRPSAAISSGAVSLRPSSRRHRHAMVGAVDAMRRCDFHSSHRFLPASARARKRGAKWRFSCIQPSASSGLGIEVQPAGLQPVGNGDGADRAAGHGQHARRRRSSRASASSSTTPRWCARRMPRPVRCSGSAGSTTIADKSARIERRRQAPARPARRQK